VGGRGQLGRSLVERLGARGTAPARDALDLAQPASVAQAVRASGASVVFNAAAYNAVDAAESDPGAAFAVNATGALHLARACAEAGALLVHVSTDYVFDGSDQAPIPEERCPRPLGVYGASKLAGEALVAASGAAHLIVRTSGVFALGGSRDKGGSFVERILARARSGQPLRVVDDQVFAPTYAPDLAAALLALVEAGAHGLVHVTNSGSCSWHELALAALRVAHVDAPVTPISARDLGAPARRPAYSVLDGARARALGLPALRPWPEALQAMLAPSR